MFGRRRYSVFGIRALRFSVFGIRIYRFALAAYPFPLSALLWAPLPAAGVHDCQPNDVLAVLPDKDVVTQLNRFSGPLRLSKTHIRKEKGSGF